ncbi:hypothetical protein DPMN_157261 [Dreissena polymorpha]|uniref:Uncharacterized protein n=1 Tax=Dreissena polymorpha TaxID=45954 RepID=A0A9D4EHJ7_DREPO|nr:hypothetical protein DPMN_157261 [Dreissena polymorpha]
MRLNSTECSQTSILGNGGCFLSISHVGRLRWEMFWVCTHVELLCCIGGKINLKSK